MLTDNLYDIAVIGSGPAGSTAAQKLSSYGLKVILFEKQNPPRYKTCGGGIVNRVIQHLPSDVSPIFEKQFNEIEIHDHQAHFHYNVKRNYPIVFAVMRDNFDFELLQRAKNSGTIIIDDCEVYDIISEDNSLKLKTKKGEFRSLFVIGADGAQGITVKKSGLKIKKKNLPALEYEVYLPQESLTKYNTLRFDFGFIPGGYAWVFPKRDHLSVGIGLFALRNIKKNLHLYLDNYLDKLEIEKVHHINKHGFYIPVSLKKNQLTKNRILLTGDAAALADPVTAEGITSAVLSGLLSAEALIEGKLDLHTVEVLYQKKINDNIFSELNAQLFLSRAYYNYSSLRIFLIKSYGVKFCELLSDVISGKKKYSQLMKNPINYLKLIRHSFTANPKFKPGHNL